MTETRETIATSIVPAIKVFQMDECTWFVGESLESCVKAYQDELVGDDPAIVADACEVPDEDLDVLIFTDIDEHEDVVSRRRFRDELNSQIAEGGNFPRIFAVDAP